MKRHPLLPSLLALLCAAALPAQDDEPPEQAPDAALLTKAEECAAEGRYKEALRLYKRLAEKFPDTPSGRAGARRSRPSAFLGSAPLVEHGPPANRLDIVLMGDGYELNHLKSFDKLAADIPQLFERNPTFGEYFSYLNFHRASLVSAENGVDGFGRDYETALNARTMGSIQGHVEIDHSAVMQMLGELEVHDRLAIVFVKNGVLGTGGGGVATIGGRNSKTTIHEFGHALSNLGDEYTGKTTARGSARGRANISDTEDPGRVPWSHWIEARVPGIGVYEGANGMVRGAFKPTASGCVMEQGEFFCRPCRERVVLDILARVDPIDGCDPAPHPLRGEQSFSGQEARELSVSVLEPASHDLRVTWYVIPASELPSYAGVKELRADRPRDRTLRGPLPQLEAKPVQQNLHPRGGLVRFEFKPKDYEPGRYRVICRVVDSATPRGEKWPWVLKDEDGLLVSERAWWAEVPAR